MPRKIDKSEPLNMRLSAEIKDKLIALCNADKRTMTNWIEVQIEKEYDARVKEG